MIGRIIKVISNDYTVLVDDKKYNCKPRGVFRNQNITPLAGDIVEINEDNIITKIFDRKNKLDRPPVSNIDMAIIVMSTTKPDFSNILLDKMLTIIEYNNIKPVICISKSDLLIDDKINESIAYYRKIGYKVLFNTEIDELKEIIKDKFVILTGQTGSGKSSLLNKLDLNLNLKTDEISLALGRGKHTTRAIEFYQIDNSFVADTPGFSSLTFNNMTKEDIKNNFIEFRKYNCKYSDCMHIKEDDCTLKEDLNNNLILKDRYDDYVSFIKEKENENISFNTKKNR